MMYSNFKAVFQIFIFTCIRAIEHNIQYLLHFKMSISQLWLSVHNWIFPQVNISFSVIKQQTINDVQQFLSGFFLTLIFTCIGAIEHNIQYLLEFKMSVSKLW